MMHFAIAESPDNSLCIYKRNSTRGDSFCTCPL